MNVDKITCAPINSLTSWEGINFKNCEKTVKRLQMRIAKAQREGRCGKVKALQWVLTHSFYAKVLAVKRVTENKGRRTPGVDGQLWKTPREKFDAVSKLKRRGYKPQPLRRHYIPKGNSGKMRALGIPTMIDRTMQTLYKIALEPVAETTADLNSYGFRPERCTHDAIEQCFKVLKNKDSAEWVLEGDIKGCFDNINHEWLIENIPMDRQILHKWLKCGYMENKEWFPTEDGTPQGGPISSILANMTLDGLEELLHREIKETRINGIRMAPKVNLVRYADDFIITGATKEILEQKVKPLVEQFMKERGLTMSKDKTHITHIMDGFDFLGQNIRKYDNGKLLIKPSKKNMHAFLEKVRRIIKKNKSTQQEMLIRILNPVIRGWANYHRHAVSKDIFGKVDNAIWESLWRWAKRRHPKKGRYWIKDRYFKVIDTRSWVFAARVEGKRGNEIPFYLRLISMMDTPIRRYTKIKAAANPYDTTWKQYFEERKGVKMMMGQKGRKELLRLWNQQKGLCPMCNQNINAQTPWVTHFTKQEKKTRKQMIHLGCHKEIHNLVFQTESVL